MFVFLIAAVVGYAVVRHLLKMFDSNDREEFRKDRENDDRDYDDPFNFTW